jgi:hypothetical protein
VTQKTWLKDVWAQSEDYEPEESVWRVEGQLRRKALSELSVNCVEQVMADPGALLDFALSWAQLRVPSADSTKARWPEDPRWATLRQAVFGGVPLGRSSRPNQLMDLERTTKQLIGAVATAGAYFDDDDFMKVLVRLTYGAEAHMIRDKVDFATLVEDKRRRVLSGAG